MATARSRILIVTDAWHPQINGVVRTLERLAEELKTLGVRGRVPDADRLPDGADADLSRHQAGADDAGETSRGRIAAKRPDHVHIATEGPLGCLARRICLAEKEHIHHQLSHALPGICQRPPAHPGRLDLCAGCADSTIPATAPWSRRRRSPPNSPRGASTRSGCGRAASTPACSGRTARTCSTCHARSSSMSAASPSKRTCPPSSISTCPAARWSSAMGRNWRRLHGEISGRRISSAIGPASELADIYASADVFVFPSRTDTFGNRIVEALASGMPVAGLPGHGPDRHCRRRRRRRFGRFAGKQRLPRLKSTAPRRAKGRCATVDGLRGDVPGQCPAHARAARQCPGLC